MMLAWVRLIFGSTKTIGDEGIALLAAAQKYGRAFYETAYIGCWVKWRIHLSRFGGAMVGSWRQDGLLGAVVRWSAGTLLGGRPTLPWRQLQLPLWNPAVVGY
jgi:hypothetical protein